MKNVIFIAPPGGGKGTMSDYLVEHYGYTHLSTGDLLRAKKDEDENIKSLLASGSLVPDEIMLDIIKEAILKLDDKKNFILDGVPRTLQQAQVLDIILSGLNKQDYVVVYIEVDKDTLEKRITGRAICPKCHKTYNSKIDQFKPKVDGVCDNCHSSLVTRDDDNVKSFETRYQQYLVSTYPLVEYYKNLKRLKVIDNNRVHQTSTLDELVGVLSD